MKFQRVFFLFVILYLFYTALVLTNGYLPDFFEHINKGSVLYANVWEHFKEGNFFVDKRFACEEYFVLDNGKFTVYYGFFPAFIRGVCSLFVEDIYSRNFNNFSILLALGVAIFFLYRTFLKLDLFKAKTRFFSVMFFTALFLASPVSYITAWGWLYNEPIIWGFAWSVGYISIFFLWVFKPENEINIKNGGLMGFCASMAVLSRVIDAIVPVLSITFLIIKAIFDFYLKKDKKQLRALSAGILICIVFGCFTMKINADKWGNPFKFQQFEKNIQVIENAERLKGIQKEGIYNLKRLPASFLYYFVPSGENFKAKFPFIDVDREVSIIKNRPYYDLIMTCRVPLTLSSLFLIIFGLLGIYKYLKFDKKEKFYLLPLILAGILQYLTLLIYGGVALRYSAGFIFLLVIFNLIFLVSESRKPGLFEKSKFLYSAFMVLLVCVYINFFTMLAYKHYIWDISPGIRNFIGRIINYTPDENHLLLIKNNTEYKKFSISGLKK